MFLLSVRFVFLLAQLLMAAQSCTIVSSIKKKKLRIYNFSLWIFKILRKPKLWRHLFVIKIIHITLTWSYLRFQTKFGPGFAVLTFIGYKQKTNTNTDRHPDKQIIYRIETRNFWILYFWYFLSKRDCTVYK